MFTVLIHLIFYQNTHLRADLHTNVLTLYTITSVYVLLLYTGMLILHTTVLTLYTITSVYVLILYTGMLILHIVHVGMLNF